MVVQLVWSLLLEMNGNMQDPQLLVAAVVSEVANGEFTQKFAKNTKKTFYLTKLEF